MRVCEPGLSNGSLIAFESWCNYAEIGKVIFFLKNAELENTKRDILSDKIKLKISMS